MRSPLPILVLYCCFALMPAFAQAPKEEVTIDSLHKQLIAVVQNEVATNKDLDPHFVQRLNAMVPVWRENQIDVSKGSRLLALQSYLNHEKVSQKTKDSVGACVAQMSELIRAQSKQLADDFVKVSGDQIRRVAKSTDPEEIRKCIADYMKFKSLLASGDVRDERSSSSNSSAVLQFMEYALKFHEYRVSENWNYAAGQIRNLEQSSSRLEFCITAAEINQMLEGMRMSIGALAPRELEALINQTLEELLDDKNQDRIDEILQQVRKQLQMNQSSASSSILASRLQRLETIGRQLQESIQRGKNTGFPQFSGDAYIRSDFSNGNWMKPVEFITRLKKYTIRSKNDAGEAIGIRLYYDTGEIKAAGDQLLNELLDDANQNRLDAVIENIKTYRQHAMNLPNSDGAGLQSKFEKLLFVGKYLADYVKNVQKGVNAPVNIDQILSAYSDGTTLLHKDELLERLKKYNVTVVMQGGATTSRPLYVDAEELLQRIPTFAQIPEVLPELTRATSIAAEDRFRSSFARWMPSIIRCAEVAKNLQSGDSFVLSTASPVSNYYGSDSSRSTLITTPVPEKVVQFEAEAEWALLKRFFPKEEYGKTEDHEAMIRKLMTRLQQEKNYQAMDQLHGVSVYFKPMRNLLSAGQVQVLRDYLDGVRQQEILEQPRMAVYHFQKVASSSSTLIDVNDLKTRLQDLRKKFPAEYAQGTEDAMRAAPNVTMPKEIEVPAVGK